MDAYSGHLTPWIPNMSLLWSEFDYASEMGAYYYAEFHDFVTVSVDDILVKLIKGEKL